jgi:hypothetical protein
MTMTDQTAEFQALAARLERAEKQLRRLAWVVPVLLAVSGTTAAYAVYSGLVVPKTVAAREFLLVDDAGRVRATLRQENGGAWLLFSAQTGTAFRAAVGVEPDGSLLVTAKGEDGKVRLALGQAGGRQGLRVGDADGAERVFVGFQPDFAGLGVWDANRTERAVLGVVGPREALALHDVAGKVVFAPP